MDFLKTIIKFIKEFKEFKESIRKWLNEIKENKCMSDVQESTVIKLKMANIIQDLRTKFSKTETLKRI